MLVTTAMPATKQEAFLFLGSLGPEVLAEDELRGDSKVEGKVLGHAGELRFRRWLIPPPIPPLSQGHRRASLTSKHFKHLPLFKSLQTPAETLSPPVFGDSQWVTSSCSLTSAPDTPRTGAGKLCCHGKIAHPIAVLRSEAAEQTREWEKA